MAQSAKDGDAVCGGIAKMSGVDIEAGDPGCLCAQDDLWRAGGAAGESGEVQRRKGGEVRKCGVADTKAGFHGKRGVQRRDRIVDRRCTDGCDRNALARNNFFGACKETRIGMPAKAGC